MSHSNEIKALVHLLEDPDEFIFDQVKDKLMQLGPNVIPYLEKAWEKDNFGDLFQDRIETLIHDIQHKELHLALLNWMNDSDNLLEGVLLVNKFQYPSLDRKSIEIQIEQITKDIECQISEEMTGLDIVMIINQVLFEVYCFKGDKKNYHNPENSYLNQVLNKKKGNPLMLSIIYIEIAKRLNIPIKGVNLPNHFIVGYLDPEFKLKGFQIEKDAHEILFYINPYSKGVILHHNEIDDFLVDLNLERLPKYYTPCSNVTIVKRILTNLLYSYSKLNNKEKVKQLKSILILF